MPINTHKYVSVKFSEPRLRERNRALSIVLDLSNYFSAAMSVDEVLQVALSRVLHFFDFEVGRIYLMDEADQSLQLAAHQGVDTGGLERMMVGEGFSGKAAQTRSFVAQRVEDLDDEKRAALLESKGLKIVVCVPLIAMDRVVGVMNLAARRVVQFDDNEIDLLISIGNLIAVATNNARLYQDLGGKVEELKAEKEAIEFFAYSISHDLKSPAIGIYGLTKLLHRQFCGVLEQKGKKYCDEILRAAEQIVRLVDRINAYVRAKEARLQFEVVEVREIIEVIRLEFAEAVNRRHLRWFEPDSPPSIVADRISIIRVLRNLVDNALKYGGENLTEIRISYESGSEEHVVSVSDDGVALKSEDPEQLFLLFHRQKTSRGVEGTGLGLATVKEIAERHHGRVWVESGEERGTTFHFSISKGLRAEAPQDE
jgi:signal transduction histidine kinase